MNSPFNIGDLVKLILSEHIGIVIDIGERHFADNRKIDVCHIKWAVGKEYTWERFYNLTLVAGVNSEKRI